ncbi:hypothetical protein D9619_007431 [Psilocybe cf. subviscida]|uniref:VWFA domain-containing protein n=1 Tax=Psilocybe cf. subviscida TaxID=2480587 RepID=A0A8H5EWT8_9AGAR|nr:hypothetical protein D9619_007431 [Psilocybe cf. subviscida]
MSQQGIIVFNIPPEWFVTVSAVSRRGHQQNALFEGDARVFQISNLGTAQGMMLETHTGQPSSTISPFWESTELTVYCSNTTATRAQTFAQLRSPEFRAHNVVVSEVFVEDNDQSAGDYDMLIVVNTQSINRNQIPPPPPANTNPGYNPVLDLPWPSTLENYLHHYETHFVVDDSGSMTQENRWDEAGNAMTGLSHAIFDNGYYRDGFNMSFLNSSLFLRGIRDRESVATLLRNVTPLGGTPTGRTVGAVFSAHIDTLDRTVGTPEYATVMPLNIVCITDGAANDPEPENELGAVLVAVGARLAAARHHPNSLGVQFVQVGSDAAAAAMLQELLRLNTGHIVDTVPWEGPGSLSPARLERILLGGLHPNIRAIRARLAEEARLLAEKSNPDSKPAAQRVPPKVMSAQEEATLWPPVVGTPADNE